MYSCSSCSYTTDRKDNFDRHLTSKRHKKQLAKEVDKQREEELNKLEKQQKQIQKRILCLQSNKINIENTTDVEEDIDQVVYCCEKCKKTYKTFKYFQQHTKKCNGIDNLTCPKCMKTFTDCSNKRKHIERKTCKPVTIFDHIQAKSKKNNTTENNPNISNSTVNSHNTYITNNHTNIYINNHGQERTDYITYDVFYDIVSGKAYMIIPEYFRIKHFHPDFPENHNIRCRNNQFFIKQNGEWRKISRETLSRSIFDNCGREVYFTKEQYKERIKKDLGVKDKRLKHKKWTPDEIKKWKDEKMQDINDLTDFSKLEYDGKDIYIKKEVLNIIDNGSNGWSYDYITNTHNYHPE